MRAIACAECGKFFGGPHVETYQEWGDEQLEAFLVKEALGLFWIRVNIGTDDVLLCDKKCVTNWLKVWPNN